jgi:TonB family protein
MKFHVTLLLFLVASLAGSAAAQKADKRISIAVLSMNNSEMGRRVSEFYRTSFQSADLEVLDSDLVRAAAQGAGYTPSTNMAVTEARTFGAVIGSDFYVLVDAQTLRRFPSSGEIYFDAYAATFLVSSRTGRLWRFQWLSLNGPSPEQAEKHVMKAISDSKWAEPMLGEVRRALEEERTARELAVGREIPIVEPAPENEQAAAAEGMQLPRPFRRLQPNYPPTAAAADVEAVVDVLVDIDKEGEVNYVSIARWAGYGLDEATIETVRKLHFFPALRDGTPIPLRVLLRYNFRKPPRQNSS